METICQIMNKVVANPDLKNYKNLITFEEDHPCHDIRYVIDPCKIQKELSWHPEVTFEKWIRKTVLWYINNRKWCYNVMSGKYKLERLGLGD